MFQRITYRAKHCHRIRTDRADKAGRRQADAKLEREIDLEAKKFLTRFNTAARLYASSKSENYQPQGRNK